MLNKVLKYLDYLFVLRPILFFPVWTLILCGYYSSESNINVEVAQDTTFIILSFILLTVTSGAVYLLNNIEDAAGDKINRKVLLIQDGFFTKKQATRYLFLLLSIGLLLAFFASFKLFLWLVASFLITGYIYSAKPFKLKDSVYGSLVVSIVSGFMTFGFGWYLQSNTLNPVFLWYALPYVLAWVSVSLLTTIPDKEGDTHEAKETVSVKHGIEKTQDIGYLLLGLSLFFSALTWDWVIGLAGALSIPAYREMFNTRTVASTLKSIRYSIGLLSAIIALVFPSYFVLLAFVYFLSKWYYKQRFNLNYPTLKTDQT
jgi:4-hydroxybenzoate polyprenyltransferase